MDAKILSAKIALRRSAQSEYESHPDFTPLKGELCLIDTDEGDLKLKVGDGFSKFSDLPFDFANITTGFYFDGNFYYDENHTSSAYKVPNKLYIDLQTGYMYAYAVTTEGVYAFSKLIPVPKASDEEFGIMKLYNETGQNVDGTMTQKSISEMISVTGEKLIIYK